jgi:BNR/Asp-box repeat
MATTKLMVAMQNSVLTFESSNDLWRTHESLRGTSPQCISFDPSNPSRAYCGTFGNGLYKTDDGGQSWASIDMKEKEDDSNGSSTDISGTAHVMSVSTSHRLNKVKNKFNAVYVGTEPTAFYRSDDGGESWNKMSALNNLMSSSLWSFPPRPWTSHIRWIEPDKTNADYVFAAIEAGALVQSHDGGKTWIDKVEGGPYDTHTLATHKNIPKRLYSSAGDGYFESYDYGESWIRPMKGLYHHYLAGLAVDSGDPNTIIVSASESAWHAHRIDDANSHVYRSSVENGYDGEGERDWKPVTKGFPESHATIISVLAANPKIAGEFYVVNNRGIVYSTDSGVSWKTLDGVGWPKDYLLQHPRALSVTNG